MPAEPDTRRRAPYRKAAEVRADLLAATRELLSERSVRAVTVRDIAARAGVQHSMITRHFGSKDALVAQAVGSAAAEYAQAFRAAQDPVEGYVLALRHLRALPGTGLVLSAGGDERADGDEDSQFPGVAQHLGSLLDAGAPDDLRTRVLAGLLASAVLGWSLGRDTAMDAFGIGRERTAEVDALAEELLAELIASQLPAHEASPARR